MNAEIASQKSSNDFSMVSCLKFVERTDPKWASSYFLNVLLAASLLALLPGCTVCMNARRTMFHEPAQFSWKMDRKRSIKAYGRWAEETWLRHSNAATGMQSPCDYEAGFKDGFVDFVNFGGNGEPPPVPPRRYWNLNYRIPSGEPSAADWFAGFRHGAQVARDEGYREKGTIDSSFFYSSPRTSNSYDSYYPEEIDGVVPSGTESMELLPPGEYGNEPGGKRFSNRKNSQTRDQRSRTLLLIEP